MKKIVFASNKDVMSCSEKILREFGDAFKILAISEASDNEVDDFISQELNRFNDEWDIQNARLLGTFGPIFHGDWRHQAYHRKSQSIPLTGLGASYLGCRRDLLKKLCEWEASNNQILTRQPQGGYEDTATLH